MFFGSAAVAGVLPASVVARLLQLAAVGRVLQQTASIMPATAGCLFISFNKFLSFAFTWKSRKSGQGHRRTFGFIFGAFKANRDFHRFVKVVIAIRRVLAGLNFLWGAQGGGSLYFYIVNGKHWELIRAQPACPVPCFLVSRFPIFPSVTRAARAFISCFIWKSKKSDHICYFVHLSNKHVFVGLEVLFRQICSDKHKIAFVIEGSFVR